MCERQIVMILGSRVIFCDKSLGQNVDKENRENKKGDEMNAIALC